MTRHRRTLAAVILAAIGAVPGSGQVPRDSHPENYVTKPPDTPRSVELAPRELRFAGSDLATAANGFSRGAEVAVAVYFECLPEISAPFERDILVNLGGIDVARIPLRLNSPEPGEFFRQTLRFRIPRYVKEGNSLLSIGLLTPKAPGQKPGQMPERLAPLQALDIYGARPVDCNTDSIEPHQETIRANAGSNLLKNGGFEDTFRHWFIPNVHRDGRVDFERLFKLSIDLDCVAEGVAAARIDFGGGQDVDFVHATTVAPVQPLTKYRLSYAIKCQNLTSHQGVAILVKAENLSWDEFYAQPSFESWVRGTTKWRWIEYEFETPRDVEQVRVIIRRPGSVKNPVDWQAFGPIGGSVWIDAVQLVPAK